VTWQEFLVESVTSHNEVRALASSSQGLAELITDLASLDTADAVIELGPGTGVFTEKIVEKTRAGSTFLAFEINPKFVEVTRRRCPRCTVVQESAVHARKYLNASGLEHCDSVVSGLPWATFSETLQDDLLDAISDALRPGGTFVAFTYVSSLLLPGGRGFRRKLHERFTEVEQSRVVWRNMPPAFVYRAVR
jgi:phosphatidylethanolamine/phosphatidyl-N-methylethanolamine N-methyltransferase